MINARYELYKLQLQSAETLEELRAMTADMLRWIDYTLERNTALAAQNEALEAHTAGLLAQVAAQNELIAHLRQGPTPAPSALDAILSPSRMRH